MPTPITLEQAAIQMGGKGGPVALSVVERSIKAGLLPVFGRGKSKRTTEEGVDRLLERIDKGEVSWPLGNADGAKRDRAASINSQAGNGKRQSRLTGGSSGAIEIVSRPPKRHSKS